MPKPEKHVFVCAQNRPPGHPRGSCVERGCGEVLDEVFRQWQERNVMNRIAVTQSGCLGPCGHGPSVVVYPDGVMYGKVTAADVSEIFERHLLGGEVVERLLMPPDIWG